MKLFRVISGCLVLALLLGGCPQLPTAEIPGGGDGSTIGGDTSLTGRPANTSGGDSTTTDEPSDSSDSSQISDCQAPSQAESWKLEVLRLVNIERSERGLSTLTWDDTLERAAGDYACELVTYNFFAHVNPETGSTLRDRALDAGYAFQIIGENLAAGQQSPITAMRDWMKSVSHRENILNPDFTQLGVAVRLGGDYGIVWVQEFGLPAAK